MVEFTCDGIWSWAFVYWEFVHFTTDSNLYKVMNLLPDSGFGDCIFIGIYPFLLGCPFYWYITAYHKLLLLVVLLWYLLQILFNFQFY